MKHTGKSRNWLFLPASDYIQDSVYDDRFVTRITPTGKLVFVGIAFSDDVFL